MKKRVPNLQNRFRTALMALALLPVTAAYSQFPAPYCAVTYPDGVEPLTLVNFAGINNTSSASGTTELEDFTAQTANVVQGSSYTFTAKGNTAGSWTNYIRVYIDWNQNNSFTDAGESFDIGTINTSTGTDAIQASASIAVPVGATAGITRMRVVKRFGQYGPDCGNVGNSLDYGQAEDYSVNVVAPATVDSVVVATQGGVPAAITTNAGTLQLVSTVYPTGGSQAVVWSIVPAGGTATISTAGLVTAMTNGNVWGKAVAAANPAYKDSILITLSNQSPPFPAPYCGTTYPDDVEPITSVVFAGINNTSSATVNGSPELEDFTSQVATVVQGSPTNAITVKGNTAGSFTNYIRVYIDWNHNNSLTDAGESYDIGTIASSTGTDAVQVTGNIAVPAGALLGNTRMRVTKRFSTYGPACNDLGDGDDYGQAEDYTVNVIVAATIDSVVVATQGGVPATITTNAGTLQLTSAIYPLAAPQNVTWSITPAGGTATISTGGLVTAVTNGNVWAKATSSANPSAKDSIQITITNQIAVFPAPYCNVTYPDDVEPITQVIFAGINNTTPASVNATPQLENFTNLTANVVQGQSYPISVKGNTAGNWTNYIRVYIDWNQNNTLNDAGEVYDIGTIVNSTGTDAIQATGTIAVPAGALTGNTRMRVTKRFGQYGLDCGDLGDGLDFGQAEDYTVNVAAPVPVDSVVVTTQGGVPATISTTNGTLQLVATVFPAAASQAVTWSVTPAGGTATISTAGLVTAQTNGNVWARAVSVQDVTKSDSILITITGQPLLVDSVVVATQGGVPATITTNAGTLQLTATVYPTLVNQAVTWTLNPASGIATISAGGLVTAQTNGTVWAKATSVQDVTKSDSIQITITGQTVPVTSVVVTTQGGAPATITTPGGTLQLVGTVLPAAASQAVTWTIIPVTGTATISAAGLVTAQTDGTVWGKATSVQDVTKSDSILITLSGQTIPVDSVVVATQGGVPAAITTNAGTLQLTATVYPALVSQAVTWSIIPVTGAATISTGGLVTAQSDGTVWAKAVSVEDPSKSDSLLITLSNQGVGLENYLAGKVELFPNPASDRVNVRMPEAGKIFSMEILSAEGRVISLTRGTGSDVESVDVSFLRPGMYTLRVRTTDGSGTSMKFIKK
ncbi:MAG: T9SS type A sorting domain-containing protein [Bacteroidia bacterium]|nr:T9SS type A sorting domain-containing protein [Bacteroidia bacterium]